MHENLSREQIDTLDRDGFLVVKDVFTPAQMSELLDCWHDLKAAIHAGTSPLRRNARFVYGTLPAPLGQLYAHPSLLSRLHPLLGPDIAVYYNRLLVKDDEWNGAVAAHQDMPYFHGSIRKYAVFVPLTRFDKASGGLYMLAGSHKMGFLGQGGTIDWQSYPQFPPVEAVLSPGDICIMDFLTWHFSEDALEAGERPVMQMVYQSADDGSHFGADFGTPSPLLACGQWRTEHFCRLGQHISPDK